METREQLQNMLKEIEKWEKEQKDLFIWEKIGRLPFAILDKLTPKVIHQKLDLLLNEVAKYIDNGGQYLANAEKTKENIQKRLEKNNKEYHVEELSTLSIEEMEKLAKELSEENAKEAKLQGFATGIGGIFTLALDIPMMLGLTLKTLQEVALSFGYDPTKEEERLFIIKCMQYSSSDIVGKKAILEELTNSDKDQSLSKLRGWKEVAMNYRDTFGWKKLFQMIPIAGMIFGGFINKQAIEDVSETGIMLYKKRKTMERLNQLQNGE